MPPAARHRPIVSCREVTKQFSQGATVVHALRGVDLEIRSGEMTLLVGPSGCGKTTLISVIASILDPTAGEVVVLDTDITRLSSSEKTAFRGRNIGFVFQEFNLLPSLTAAENAAVPLIIAGWWRDKAVEQSTELLKQVGLGHRLGALPSQMSGGEQQRVAVARALVHKPKLIVCDEPTSALDAKTGHAIMELLYRMAVQPDRAVVVVTHDPRVYPFGDRTASMEDGRVTGIESKREAAAQVAGQAGVP